MRATFDDALGSLAVDATPRWRQFEELCRWYLLNAPEYARRVHRVYRWDEWPRRDGPDTGIDLVAETDEGLWAIQAKCYSEAHAITKRDVDSFLSASSRPEFVFRLLMATTDFIGANARRALEGQERPVGLLLRSQFEASAVDWPSSIANLRPAKPARRSPRPHQRKAINAAVRGFAHARRGQIIMPCGSGKTLVALWISEALSSKRTLVLVPSLSLLAQTLREWTAHAQTPFVYLPVCSDESVQDHDAFVANTIELGFPTTTDPQTINAFLRAHGSLVVFATYQSSGRIAEAQQAGSPAFDLVVCDEAHRLAGPVGSDFASVLDQDKIRAGRRLFMTATPRYFTGRVLNIARKAELDVASMDDASHFGEVFHLLSFGQAIERNLLSDYQVSVIGVTDSTAGSLARRGGLVSTDGGSVTNSRNLASQVGLAKAMRDYDLRKVISFHSRVAKARHFSEETVQTIAWMPEDDRPPGSLWSQHISGEMSAGRRDSLLRHLRDLHEDQRGLLSNARCLAEGVDIPAIDGVAFIDPKGSEIDIIQAVGHAIRKSPDKRVGTIVIPVFIDEHDEPEAVLSGSAFATVWAVLKALRSHDETLAEELDSIRREMGRVHAPVRRPDRIRLDVPWSEVDEQFAGAFNARLIETTTASWEYWFGLLEQFAEHAGHTKVPLEHCVDTWRLGSWVATQRKLGRDGSLLAERRALLEGLPGWSWAPASEQWDEGLNALQAFAAREGHATVPKRHVESGVNLGTWVQHQRTDYREGTLESQRIALIESVPGWVWNTKDERWEKGYTLLNRFVSRNGHAEVPDTHSESGFPLGHWVRHQRQMFRRQILSPDRQAKLQETAGWSWGVKDGHWQRAFRLLCDYEVREGDTNVPGSLIVEGVRFGHWVLLQRSLFKKGRLSPERARRLESLATWTWDTREQAWDRAFETLRRYSEREGMTELPNGYVEDGLRLSWWLGTQRKAYKDGSLPPERRRRLESLAGWSWDDKIETKWEEGFKQLTQYAEHEGEAFVPVEFVDAGGFPLGQWTAVQRRRRAIGKLSAGRVHRLQSLPGWKWDMVAARQERAMSVLRRFVAREGHAHVPVAHVEDGFSLGAWASERRKAFREGKLDRVLVKEFEDLPGWRWDPATERWEQGFAALEKYVARMGTARVPQGHVEHDYPLGQWVGYQRQAFRRGTLDPARQIRLASLPGWLWSTRSNVSGADVS